MRFKVAAAAIATEVNASAVGECGLGRIRRCGLHMDDGTVNVRVKDGAHIIKVVMFVFEVLAGPGSCSASCREVGRYGPVLKTNARDDGVVQKRELFCLEGD